MKTSTLIALIIALVVVVSLVTVWFYPSIQDFMAGNTMWNGINKFLEANNARNIDSLGSLSPTPENDVLVEIPYLNYSQDDLLRLKEFVNNGGTLILMDDFGYGNSFLNYTGLPARFNGKILLDPLFNSKNEYLPRIIDFTPDIKNAGVNVIGLNHATALDNVDSANAMAWSSNMSFIDENGNGNQDANDPKGPFVVAAKYALGKGNIELVSDPSVIINTMLGQNNNNVFMQHLINVNGAPQNILLDRSHLSKAPLDTSKMDLQAFRNAIASPYALVGILGAVFVIIYLFKRGVLVG